MGTIRTYFKEHPWQRRAISILLVVIAGSIVGRLTYPWYLWYEQRQANQRLIEQLGDADPYRREVAVQKAILLGQKHEELASQLIAALDTPDEGRFLSLYYVLQRLGKLDTPDVNPRWLDRHRLLEFKAAFASGEEDIPPSARETAAPTALVRRWYVRQALLCGRNNEYLRRMLIAAANDSSVGVRESAASLAARLGDDDVLAGLLRDPAARVRSATALAAGLAKRTALAEPIRRQFESRLNLVGPSSPDGIDQIASDAYALALLDPAGSSELLCHTTAARADQPELQDRLLLALEALNDEEALQTVQDLLHADRWAGRSPSGVALYVAGKMHLPEATEIAMEALRAAAEGSQPLSVSRVLGAVDVVAEADYPCRTVAYALCRDLWQPGEPALLTRLAHLLGVQAATKGQLGYVPSRAACVETLRDAAQYSRAGREEPVTTPLPSAAAAVALWTLDPAEREFARLDSNDASVSREAILNIVESKTSLFYLREATAADDPAACDYVAWHVGRSGLSQAPAVGRAFLPVGRKRQPEYNADVRACGAMILALSANDQPQRQAAVEHISRRLAREEYPAAGSLRCALLMAGQTDQLAKVRMLLEMEDFPAARALLALLVAGDKTTLDWLLWNTNWNLPVPLEDIPPLLIDQVIGEVLQTAAPSLPTICPAADEATRLWQANILRHAYGIRRASVRVGLR